MILLSFLQEFMLKLEELELVLAQKQAEVKKILCIYWSLISNSTSISNTLQDDLRAIKEQENR